jgi:hypothetical protein
MAALFRYVWLKTLRERLILPALLTPVVVVNAPVVGLLFRSVVTGKDAHPFRFPTESPAASLSFLVGFAAFAAAFSGGIAAFWILREEIANRSIAAMILATRPIGMSAVSILYGVAVAVISFAMTLAMVCLLTLSIPEQLGWAFASLVGAAVVVSAIGAACVAISPDAGMVLPMFILALPLFIGIFDRHQNVTAFAVFVAVGLAVVAATIMERRCGG